jgi:carboxyl-terminal processing protease
MKKIINRHPYLAVLASILLGVVITLIGGWFFLVNLLNGSGSSKNDLNRVSSVYNQITQDYYRNVDSSKLATGAINGMLSTLDDPFSNYLTGEDATSLNNDVSGSFGGIGIQVVKKDGQIEVMAPIDGTPAQKAGLKAGDVVLAVDGKSLSDKSLSQAMVLMRGKVGSKVKVKLQRGDTTFTKTMSRAKIPVDTVNSKILKHHVGYIVVSSVAEKTASDLKKALKKLDQQGAKSYIVDVRNNPGGLMQEALKMSSMFLKDGKPIMQVKSRNGKAEVYKASKKLDGGYKVKKPTVVMINGESASAAEIFAAALHQSANIKLVGSKSYGKGTVQNITEYTDSDELKLTIAKWLTPDGTWIHKKGIKPDYQADYPAMAYITTFDKSKTYSVGESNEDIKNVQVALKDLGFFDGKPTKNYTDEVKTAVEAYQTKHQLTANGIVDAKTMTSIEQEVIKTLAKNDPALDRAEQVVGEK